MKVLLSRFHANGHIIGFHPHRHKVRTILYEILNSTIFSAIDNNFFLLQCIIKFAFHFVIECIYTVHDEFVDIKVFKTRKVNGNPA